MRERGQHHADVENLVGRKEVVELPRPQPLRDAVRAVHSNTAVDSGAHFEPPYAGTRRLEECDNRKVSIYSVCNIAAAHGK